MKTIEQTKYFILYKPYNVLSQFTKEHPDHQVLGDIYKFPVDCYPIGRLDKDSEGLLILSNDASLNKKLLDPINEHRRTYYVQVEGKPKTKLIDKLKDGVEIKIKRQRYQTLPCQVQAANDLGWIKDRTPPIRYRKNIPTSWWRMTLHEGKNRQVRKMFAGIGHPVLRLIRSEIEDLSAKDYKIGDVRSIDKKRLYQLLKM